MKLLRTLAISSALASSLYALPYADIDVSGKVGVSIVSLDKASFDKVKTELGLKSDNVFKLSYGANVRIWLGDPLFESFRVAPAFSWSRVSLEKDSYNNLQYGLLVGYTVADITPYLGASFSHFLSGKNPLDSTFAVNYGVKYHFSSIFLTVGIDGSFQKPKFAKIDNKRITINTIGATIGFQI